MPATNAWENELRDEIGRWTTGGSGAVGAEMKDKLQAQAGPLLEGMRAGSYNRYFVNSVAVGSPHLERMAQLLATWSQAGDEWSDRAFRDHFFSPLHKQEFAASIRQAAQSLHSATTATDHRTAASDLGWRIGQYGPDHWVKDLPALQARADAALDPKAESRGLEGCGTVKHATSFEYAGRKAALCRRNTSAAFDGNAMGTDGKLVSLADRPVLTLIKGALDVLNPISTAEAAEVPDAKAAKAPKTEQAEMGRLEHWLKAGTIDPLQQKPVTDKPPEQVRADIARIARGYEGSGNWLYTKDGKSSYKCNIFVGDVLREAGIPVDGLHLTHTGWAMPTAGDWSDPDQKIPGWEVVDIKDAKPGDIIAERHPYSTASGHVGIVVGDHQTASSSAEIPGDDKGKIKVNDWGFREKQPSGFLSLPDNPPPVVRRYVGYHHKD
jgi:cell wall-associated NlpC family hydrolase